MNSLRMSLIKRFGSSDSRGSEKNTQLVLDDFVDDDVSFKVAVEPLNKYLEVANRLEVAPLRHLDVAPLRHLDVANRLDVANCLSLNNEEAQPKEPPKELTFDSFSSDDSNESTRETPRIFDGSMHRNVMGPPPPYAKQYTWNKDASSSSSLDEPASENPFFEKILSEIKNMNVLTAYQLYYIKSLSPEKMFKLIELYNTVMHNVNEIL